MTLTVEATHWLAGWLEGEGTFYGQTMAGTGYTRLIVRAVSTDKDTVEHAKCLAGVGRIYGPYRYGTNKQYNWQWAVCRRRDAYELMVLLRPLMGKRRREQIDAALEIGAPHGGV